MSYRKRGPPDDDDAHPAAVRRARVSNAADPVDDGTSMPYECAPFAAVLTPEDVCAAVIAQRDTPHEFLSFPEPLLLFLAVWRALQQACAAQVDGCSYMPSRHGTTTPRRPC